MTMTQRAAPVKRLPRTVCKDAWEGELNGGYGRQPEQVTLERRTTCRACLQPMAKGQAATMVLHYFESAAPSWMTTKCYIHTEPCVDISRRGLDTDYHL